MSHKITRTLYNQHQIATRIEQIATEIITDFKEPHFILVGVLRGSFMFISDLVRALYEHQASPRIDFMTLESYGAATVSSGNVRIMKDVHLDLTGAKVLLVDDILDSGRTLNFARKHLENKGATYIKTCTLLDKPSRRVVPIEADYVGFTIEDLFVVGFGLDYDSYYREVPYIGEVTISDEANPL